MRKMSATYEYREDIESEDFDNAAEPTTLVTLNLRPATRAGYRRFGENISFLNGSGTCYCKKKWIYIGLLVIVLVIVLGSFTYFLACDWLESCSSKVLVSIFMGIHPIGK